MKTGTSCARCANAATCPKFDDRTLYGFCRGFEPRRKWEMLATIRRALRWLKIWWLTLALYASVSFLKIDGKTKRRNGLVNKVIIIGNLGADSELRHTQSGDAVATFRVATTDRWKGKDGQMQESTEWHSCVAWRRLAEICSEYLAKGSKVYVEGKLQTRKWQDQNGNDRYTTEIIVREMKILSPKPGTSGGGGDHYSDPPPMGDDIPFD